MTSEVMRADSGADLYAGSLREALKICIETAKLLSAESTRQPARAIETTAA
jgi:hypothetical protein